MFSYHGASASEMVDLWCTVLRSLAIRVVDLDCSFPRSQGLS